MKIRKEVILQIIGRTLLGIAGMYLINILFRVQDYSVSVGINAVSAAIITILGVPGFLLIFGTAIYYSY